MKTSTNNSVNTTAKINVTEDNRVIESAKVTVDKAVAILNRLNYMGATFQYRFTTREYNADIEYRNFNAYKADGTGVRFSLTEIVINGKLEIVRFCNHYRNITVDLQVGNVAYTYGYKFEIEIVETDPDTPLTDETPTIISDDDFKAEIAAINPNGKSLGAIDLKIGCVYAKYADLLTLKLRAAVTIYPLETRINNLSLPASIKITTQNCKTFQLGFGAFAKYFVSGNYHSFAIQHNFSVLGRYNTPEQVIAVINRIEAAVKNGDKEFVFPTVYELTATPTPDTPTVEEHKPTVEIKTAKNGTKIFYADRKRVSRDTALKIAERNRGDNLFNLEWEHEISSYHVNGGLKKSVHTSRKTLRELEIRIDEYHGYTVICNGSRLHTFSYKNNAVWLVNAIIKAYIGGERGIKIERSGQVVIVDAEQSKTA